MAAIVALICHWPMSTRFHVSSVASIQHNLPDGTSKANFGQPLLLARFSGGKHLLSDENVAG